MGIKVKHLIGWHKSEQMNNPGYFEKWKSLVEEEEANGNEVLVISVPKGQGMPEAVEAFLQDGIKG